MVQAISTYVFLRRRLHANLLDTLASTGAHAVEIYAARQHFDYTSTTDIRELADWFRSHPLQPLALHAPLFGDKEMGRSGAPSVNVVHGEKSRRIDAMDEIKRALESAEQIPFAYLILHLGDSGDAWNQRALEHSLTAVEHLRAFAAPLGVKLLLENLANEVAQPENLAEIITAGHFRDVGVCFDVGHAHLNGGILTGLNLLAPYIRCVHLHDNAGDRDAHLWPGVGRPGGGKIAWSETLRTLARMPHSPAQVLEIHSSLDAPGEKVEPALVQDFQETFAWLAECAAAGK